MRLRTIVGVILSFMLLDKASLAQQVPGRTPSGADIHAIEGSNARYGRLPLVFERNQGQADPEAKFIFRGRGYSALLTSGSMVLSLRPTKVVPIQHTENGVTTSTVLPPPTTMQFQLVGATQNPLVVGEDPLTGKVNYFIGNNPSQWHRNVATYAKVRYKNVYPGIDLIYYGNHQQLEYDFAVSPGADPRQIQFEIQGANEIRVDAQGNLILTTGVRELHFLSPNVYQESNGSRIPVEGGYAMKDSTHIGFQVNHYDSTKPLVIDPVLEYSTYLGGSDTQPTGIAVDKSGNIYITGYADSPAFPLTTLGPVSANTGHVFIAKMDATGSNLVYADYIGGNGTDYGTALALDSANEAYITGNTQSNNFPTVKAYQSQQPGPYTGFLLKLSADGASLLYSTYLGGSSLDQPTSIALDSSNETYVAGYTQSLNFPVANAYQATALPNQGGIYGTYGFLTKFSADGLSLVYSTLVAGNTNVLESGCCWPTPYNAVSAVAVDANDDAYVAGATNTYNFPVTSGSFQTTNSTQQDSTVGFVSKFTSAGGLGYSTYFYGSGGYPVAIAAITVDNAGSAYITGSAYSDGTFPITSTSICDPGTYGFGCGYAFVTKFDPAAATLLYSTFLGPNNYAAPQAIALDANDDAYILASSSSSTFVETNGIEPYDNGVDTLLVEIDPAAGTELFATYLGGGGDDVAAGMVLDSAGNMFVAGSTDSSDFPTTQGVFQTTGGNGDAFIAKIGASSAPSVSLSPNSLQFGTLPIGSTSQSQTVLLRNMGSSPLAFSSITANGDFAETDSCGTSISAAASCTFSVTFTPTAGGLRSGSILIHDDAAGSPHVINLSGTGPGPVVALTPVSLAFSAQPVGTSGAAQAVTLTNSGNATLNISSIQVSGDFAQTDNCPNALPPNSSCTVNITFTPTASGTRNGTLTINDNAQGSPQVANLAGVGTDFSLMSSQSSDTLKAGATATYQLSVSPVGGPFLNTVKLSCNGTPALATCSISPNALTPNGSAAMATLTITTTALVAQSVPIFPPRINPIYAVWMQFQGIGLFGMIVASPRSRSRKLRVIALLTLILAALVLMSSCAGGTGITTPPHSGTTPGTYTITVTGTSGTLRHSIPVTLIVQ